MPEKEQQQLERITVVLPQEIAAQLRQRAKREATPVSILIRRWIVERLEKEAAQ